MTFAQFCKKHEFHPQYKTPGSPGWLELIDNEVQTIHNDYPAVTSWDNVPVGTNVFIRWWGGNRGVYVRTATGISCGPDDLEFGLPRLGTTRCDTAAWIDVGEIVPAQ